MATRALIARQISGDRVRYVYSQYDNYIDTNGILLYNHYNSVEKIEELFSQEREIRSLKDSVKKTGFFSDRVEIKECEIEDELNEQATENWAFYIYIFTLKGEWEYRELLYENGKNVWSKNKSLKEAIEELEQGAE